MKPKLKFMLKICQIIIMIFMLGLIAFRITIWIIIYHDNSGNYFLELTDNDEKRNQSKLSVESNYFYVTICNINIARGSSLFQKFDSLDKFDKYVQAILKWQQTPSLDSLPEQVLINQSAHRLVDMLKICRIGATVCSIHQFVRHISRYGVCFSMKINYTELSWLKIALDPEEFDYLLPNFGVVGFNIFIHNRLPLDRSSMSENMVVIGPSFETMVRAKISHSMRNICNSQFTCIVQMNCNKNCWRSKITVSPGIITQAVRSPYYMEILSRKFDYQIQLQRDINRVQLGLSLQQRSFIQAANISLFKTISNLTTYFVLTLRGILKKIDSHMTEIQAYSSNQLKFDEECLHGLSLSLSRLGLLARDYWHKRKSQDFLESKYLQSISHVHLYVINCFFSGIKINSPILIFLQSNLAIVSNFKVQLQNGDLHQISSDSSNKDCLSSFSKHKISFFRSQVEKLEQSIVLYLGQLNEANTKLYILADENRSIRAKFSITKIQIQKLTTEKLVSIIVLIDRNQISEAAYLTSITTKNDLGGLLNSVFTTIGFSVICLLILAHLCKKKKIPTKSIETSHLMYQSASLGRRSRIPEPQTEQFTDTSFS